MKSKRPFTLILVLLFSAAVYFGIAEFICRNDSKHIEQILSNDQQFRNVKLSRKGLQLALTGQVYSTNAMSMLTMKINNVKHSRVVCFVRVGTPSGR